LLKPNPAQHQRANETLPCPSNAVCWIHIPALFKGVTKSHSLRRLWYVSTEAKGVTRPLWKSHSFLQISM
jgi:hypothetical protein